MKILRVHSFLYQYNKSKCVNVFLYVFMEPSAHIHTQKGITYTITSSYIFLNSCYKS